jgi:PAS domain S-box-containing protein
MVVDAIEDADRLSAETLGLAVEACPCGMLVAGEEGFIILVNREIERLFGYARGELIGRPVDILLPENLRNKHAEQRRNFSQHPQARRLGSGRDFNGRRKDGSEFPVEVGLNPIALGGKSMVAAAIIDIGERKGRERMQEETVATVSHELRTPMTSIAASLGLLRAGIADNLPQPAAHLLEIAQANCQRLVRMVSDILDSKKLDAGQMVFHFAPYDARMLLEQAIEANGGYAAVCGVCIRLEAATAPIEIEVDADRFIQVITNLLSNALKFSKSGDDVVVTLEARDGNVRIAVRDHGPGIPAEFRPRVFEAFTQAESPAGRRPGGSGLGLSIARAMVAHMHGHIGFADAAGGGTVFHVDLPVAKRTALAAEPARAARAG